MNSGSQFVPSGYGRQSQMPNSVGIPHVQQPYGQASHHLQRAGMHHVVHQQPTQNHNVASSISPCGDSFGLLGLALDHHTNGTTPDQINRLHLCRGFDLATLSLDLVDSQPIHVNFGSPWDDGPACYIIEHKVPTCYKASVKLDSEKIDKFSDETLFYMFYAMPKESEQIQAAKALMSRKWRWHMQRHQWMIPKEGSNIQELPDKQLKAVFNCFNPMTFKSVVEECAVSLSDMAVLPDLTVDRQQGTR